MKVGVTARVKVRIWVGDRTLQMCAVETRWFNMKRKCCISLYSIHIYNPEICTVEINGVEVSVCKIAMLQVGMHQIDLQLVLGRIKFRMHEITIQ